MFHQDCLTQYTPKVGGLKISCVCPLCRQQSWRWIDFKRQDACIPGQLLAMGKQRRTINPLRQSELKDIQFDRLRPNYYTIPTAWYGGATSGEERIEIPVYLDSLEFLHFAGLEDAAAQQIHASWRAKCDGNKNETLPIYQEAVTYIKRRARLHDAVRPTQDWDGALKNLGVTDKLRQAIMDPKFEHVRLTKCACYWAADSVKEAYFFLLFLDLNKKQKA